MTENKITADDAKLYCPTNSKCRGDNQTSLCSDDFDEGMCEIDSERCHYATCLILKKMMEYSGECP
jgi:hypothetical protein